MTKQKLTIASGFIVILIIIGFSLYHTTHFQTRSGDTTISTQTLITTDSNKKTIKPSLDREDDIVFLHHSTGGAIWDGGVADLIDEYNNQHSTQYNISEIEYPSDEYGWENYPYDYWNIWVNHGDRNYYQGQPTLKTLTKKYDVIIFKHCFPVGDIQPDDGVGDVSSSEKTLANYKLQYQALKDLMYQYKDTKFIVWTGAVLVKESTTPEHAKRQKEFVDWVKNTWDEPDDNIYIFDFYSLETDGGLYMKDEYSQGGGDSHPNEEFSQKAAKAFVDKIVEVVGE